jgi:DNA-binding transcriptional regulator LsrR (DeoR family)
MSVYNSLMSGDPYTPPRSSRLKLSAVDVADIRRLYHHEGWTQVALAEQYGVTQPQISKVINKLQWKDSS